MMHGPEPVAISVAVSPPARLQLSAQIHGWLLLLPAAVLLVTFTHYPAIATIIDSFFSTPKGRRAAVFVGADNYQAMLGDPVFWRALGNNIVYAASVIPLTIALSLAMALDTSFWLRSSTPLPGRDTKPQFTNPENDQRKRKWYDII